MRTLAGLGIVLAIMSPVAPRGQIQTTPDDGTDHVLWYRQPASQWDHALPVGSGRLGAMVFGTVARERIQLNEESLWMPSGDPRKPHKEDRDNPDALTHLPEVRKLLFAGRPVEAYRLAEKYMMGRPSSRIQSYQTLGDLRLTFEHDGQTADYRR